MCCHDYEGYEGVKSDQDQDRGGVCHDIAGGIDVGEYQVGNNQEDD